MRYFLFCRVWGNTNQVPVEPSPEVRGGADVGEVVHGDDVDDGADDAAGVLGDALKHWFL